MVVANRSPLEPLARLGYAARGVVNLLIGLLALLAALGPGGEATGSKGALQTLLSQPLGDYLLGVVAFGLFGFAVWRFLQALFNADRLDSSIRSTAIRLGQGISAVLYAGLGVFAISLVVGWEAGGGNEEQAARDWTRWLLAKPFGRWLVGAAGLAIAGAGLGMARKAWSASFTRHLSCSAEAASWVVPLGRAGYAARCVVFLIIGAFLVVAGYQSDPSEAHGVGGALLALQGQPFGRTLYGVVACGLAAFGVFQFAAAKYRRINAPDGQEILKMATTRRA